MASTCTPSTAVGSLQPPELHRLVTLTPLPAIPWQRTGNHWLSLPCIHPGDGAIHCVGMLHRGARGAVEFAGDARFAEGVGQPIARPVFSVDGETVALAPGGLAWERAVEWLPTFSGAAGPLLVRGTVFAPFGRDADTAGAVYAIALENRGDRAVTVGIAL